MFAFCLLFFPLYLLHRGSEGQSVEPRVCSAVNQRARGGAGPGSGLEVSGRRNLISLSSELPGTGVGVMVPIESRCLCNTKR